MPADMQKSDSPARVALELAREIANSEPVSLKRDRAYWFTLFHASWLVVHGQAPKESG